jgi:hypothetical protein
MLEMTIPREDTTFQKMVVEEGAFLRGLLEALSAAVNSEVCVCAVPFNLPSTTHLLGRRPVNATGGRAWPSGTEPLYQA